MLFAPSTRFAAFSSETAAMTSLGQGCSDGRRVRPAARTQSGHSSTVALPSGRWSKAVSFNVSTLAVRHSAKVTNIEIGRSIHMLVKDRSDLPAGARSRAAGRDCRGRWPRSLRSEDGDISDRPEIP